MIFLSEAAWITRPLVAPVDATGDETPANYLGWLRTLSLPDILEEQYPSLRPAGTLFDLARAAVLTAADADARRALVEDGGVDPVVFDDPRSGLNSIADRLSAPTPNDPLTPLGARLRFPGVPEAREILRADAAIAQIANLPVATLEILIGGALGLLSHRLDAWYTGFAAQRLRDLRRNPAPGTPTPHGFGTGINVGAYGWLERIPRRAPVASAGHVHAPSAQHAATAGVLLSVDAAHRASGNGSAFAVDLSSARVRAALELLEGVRAGQPLEALVGYRIERALVDAGGTAPALIARLREAAPLVANRLIPGPAAAASVAASNVVDGLALLRLATADGTKPALVDRLPGIAKAANDEQRNAFGSALAAAADAVDAVGDLVLAESVFHLVGGQPGRSGAATDVLAGALVPPPEADVVSTPVRGIATTHRVFIALDRPVKESDWGTSPRAVAEPLVDAWAASLLPLPSAIRLRADFLDATGKLVETVDVTLQDLLADARDRGRDELAVGALDVVLGSLEPRIAPLMELRRPEVSAQTTLALHLERDATFAPEQVSIRELALVAADLRALMGSTRPLRPDDLPFGASVDTTEIAERLADATKAVTAARDDLAAAKTDANRVRALLAADHLGVAAHIDPGQLAEQAAAARAQLDARLTAAGDTSRSFGDRLIALFGPTMLVVPRLACDDDDALLAFGEDLGEIPSQVRAFLARAARVRTRVALLRAVLGNADALRGIGAHELHVAQRPCSKDEQWTALPGPVAGGRTSLVAVGGSALPGAGRMLAGLFVDDWVEVVPFPHADTSVAFHLPAPSAAAPNALLLCIPEPTRETWSEADLLSHILEARELGRLRAVDPDGLGVAAHVLPGLLADDTAFGASLAERLSELAGAAQ